MSKEILTIKVGDDRLTYREYADRHLARFDCRAVVDIIHPDTQKTASANVHLTLQRILDILPAFATPDHFPMKLGYLGDDQYQYVVHCDQRRNYLELHETREGNSVPLCRVYFELKWIDRYTIERPHVTPDGKVTNNFSEISSFTSKNCGVTPIEMALLQLLSGQLQRMHRERKQ